VYLCASHAGAHPGGGGIATGLRPHPNRNLKYTGFVDTISNVLDDLPCSHKPPLNRMMTKFGKWSKRLGCRWNKKTRILDIVIKIRWSEHLYVYKCSCSVKLQLWLRHDFYNIIFKIKRKLYTGCPRRNGQNLWRVFLMLNYTDITQNTYIQSWTVTEIMTNEKCGLLGCPRTVRRSLRMPGNETPLANSVMQWPWRDNGTTAACVNYLET